MKRHIVQPLMSYKDPDGRTRHALSGEDVDVHPDHFADFDKVNDPDGVSTPRAKTPPPAPKKKARQ